MDGYVLIDKPVGWTSFDVVNYIRKIVAKELNKKPKNVKVGHAGTLDPFATGLLIVLAGTYTKRQDEFMKQDKVYEATLKLGFVSTTGDPEGITTEVSTDKPANSEVKIALESFAGEIEQIPPIFSAIKINGKKAYELARAGKTVELKPRKVTIHSIELLGYTYPELKIRCHVSSGTYIRSLAADIGETLKTGAYLTSLNRVSIGHFDVGAASQPQKFEPTLLKQLPNR